MAADIFCGGLHPHKAGKLVSPQFTGGLDRHNVAD
ncbi:hypothetical protein A2U01_0017953, partial [Trifolium medium]|nr:hypothetical protein [Trifolium medium]